MLLSGKSDKQKTVWFYGAPNTGKSTFALLLSEIFCCEMLKFSESKLSTVESGVANPHLVLVDEANWYDLFKPGALANTKSFFEGKGLLRRELYKAPSV